MAATNLPVALVNEPHHFAWDEDAAVTDRLRQLIALTRQVGSARRKSSGRSPCCPMQRCSQCAGGTQPRSELRAELASGRQGGLGCARSSSGTGCG